MMENNIVSDTVKRTDQHRIDLIRNLRNDLIKDFLDDRNLMTYFVNQYNWKELNNRRIEFIKKELRELLISPVDLAHYATLMIEMKQNNSASLTGKNDKLFYDELDKIFRKYVF